MEPDIEVRSGHSMPGTPCRALHTEHLLAEHLRASLVHEGEMAVNHEKFQISGLGNFSKRDPWLGQVGGLLLAVILIHFLMLGERKGKDWARQAELLVEHMRVTKALPVHDLSQSRQHWETILIALEGQMNHLPFWERRKAREWMGVLYGEAGDFEQTLFFLEKVEPLRKLSPEAQRFHAVAASHLGLMPWFSIAANPNRGLHEVRHHGSGSLQWSGSSRTGTVVKDKLKTLESMQQTPAGIWQLRAIFHLKNGNNRLAENQPESALVDYRKALLAEEQHQQCFPSSFETYLNQVAIYLKMMELETDHTEYQVSGYLERALRLCDVAETLLPGDCKVTQLRGRLFQATVRNLIKNGGNTKPFLEQMHRHQQIMEQKCLPGIVDEFSVSW